MARTRDDDERDDENEDRPRGRSREDDDSEERPRRRRRRDDDDDDDDRPRRRRELGPLDSTFRDTNIVVLILFACCCRGIAFILALICYLTAKDEKAKSNAMIVLLIDAVLIVVAIILNVAGVVKPMNFGR